MGFATTADKSWLAGNSPTYGFLMFGADSMFKSLFNSMAGNQLVDILFMLGLLGLGLGLLLGVMVKIASYAAILLMALMWLALVPGENNPVIDEHLIYILVFIGLAITDSGKTFGLGNWWAKKKFVKKNRVLE